MRKTAIFKNDLFLEHNPGQTHVESPERLEVIHERLAAPEIIKTFHFPAFGPASREILQMNHTPDYVNRVASTGGKPFDSLDPDTMTSARSYDAACLAAGAVVEGTRLLTAGEIDNCFALVRPPGHHAEAGKGMGFCLFNNIAIGARYAIRKLNLDRVMIVDWDLHHGNGTQHSFYNTDQVLYFSTHQFPYYPGTGSLSEVGEGRGEGFTINVPLPGGQDDFAFASIFNDILSPIARQYKPDLIMISAGFDIYTADPLGGMAVTEKGFAYMTRVLQDLSDEICGGRLLATLEGGYDLNGLRDGVMAVLWEMAGTSILDDETTRAFKNTHIDNQDGMFASILKQTRNIAKNYWTL